MLEELRRKVNTKPSEAQKKAGNYAKGHITLRGLRISVENTKGSIRKGKSSSGKEWAAVLPDHYGYIKRTKGSDGDHIDCYIGPDRDFSKVYVIDQRHHNPGNEKHGTFDEHKCMIGYSNLEDAKKAYRAAFSDGHDRILHVTVMTLHRFKEWVHDNRGKKKPLRYFAKS